MKSRPNAQSRYFASFSRILIRCLVTNEPAAVLLRVSLHKVIPGIQLAKELLLAVFTMTQYD